MMNTSWLGCQIPTLASTAAGGMILQVPQDTRCGLKNNFCRTIGLTDASRESNIEVMLMTRVQALSRTPIQEI
jgi:hypothetical protein